MNNKCSECIPEIEWVDTYGEPYGFCKNCKFCKEKECDEKKKDVNEK